MNQAIIDMLALYQINSVSDAENALKEIIQEITLLGLHRANFFEKAAFYGGTSLRILYNLPRYSEDLDFTLFKQDSKFNLAPYFSFIEKELEAYGFEVKIERVNKINNSNIESAFIKANTKIHFLKIKAFDPFGPKVQANTKLQIKFEVDTQPAINFESEARYLLSPISFPIITLKKPDLFAGKIHALLYRKWNNRVKGRDFYDYIWYLKNKIPVRLDYLREKAIQSKHCKANEFQNLEQLKKELYKRFKIVNFAKAKEDVLPFIKDPQELSHWNIDFFMQITEKIKVV